MTEIEIEAGLQLLERDLRVLFSVHPDLPAIALHLRKAWDAQKVKPNEKEDKIEALLKQFRAIVLAPLSRKKKSRKRKQKQPVTGTAKGGAPVMHDRRVFHSENVSKESVNTFADIFENDADLATGQPSAVEAEGSQALLFESDNPPESASLPIRSLPGTGQTNSALPSSMRARLPL